MGHSGTTRGVRTRTAERLETHTDVDGKGGRNPSRVSFRAVSWTAVAPRDLKRRLTYLLSEALGPSEGSAFFGRTETLECEVARWPHDLHLLSFDLLGTNNAQAHASWSLVDPVQVIGVG